MLSNVTGWIKKINRSRRRSCWTCNCCSSNIWFKRSIPTWWCYR